MKRLALSAVFALCVMTLLIGCNKSEQAALRVAVVDTGKVFQESVPGKAGVAYLEKVSTQAQDEFIALQAQGQGKAPSEEDSMRMQRALGELQQRMNSEQQTVITKLNDAFRKALDTYRVEHGLDIILPSEQALAFGASADITPAIIAVMDTVQLSFGEPEGAAGATPPAQANASSETAPAATK